MEPGFERMILLRVLQVNCITQLTINRIKESNYENTNYFSRGYRHREDRISICR
jgi:hypothetical protein